jgi:hypothetical protein
MSTVPFTILGTIWAFSRFRDFPRAEDSVIVICSFLATSLGTRLGSEQSVTRAALKVCDLGACVSSRVIGVTVRARGISLADSILEDARRADRVIFPDTDPVVKLVLLRAVRS